MTSPFKIEGPAVISFSGGRTSAYMLRRILDEGLEPDVHVVFADTGKEREETYDFIRECSSRWGVEVAWVQREGGFEKLCRDRKYLPNAITRMCTSELKVAQIKKHMVGLGYDWWSMVVGLRADEPRRVAKRRGSVDKFWDYELPLADAGVTEQDVMDFWAAQPFDLDLRQHEGNCDLCFLKGKRNLLKILVDRPELADWWMKMEEEIGGRFRNEWSYQDLVLQAEAMRRQAELDIDVKVEHICKPGRPVVRKSDDGAIQLSLMAVEDDTRPCFCTD